MIATTRRRTTLILRSGILALLLNRFLRSRSRLVSLRGGILGSIVFGGTLVAPTAIARAATPLASPVSTPAVTATLLLLGSIYRPFTYPLGHLALGNFITQKGLDTVEFALLLLRHEGNGGTVGIGTRRTTDTVDITSGS